MRWEASSIPRIHPRDYEMDRPFADGREIFWPCPMSRCCFAVKISKNDVFDMFLIIYQWHQKPWKTKEFIPKKNNWFWGTKKRFWWFWVPQVANEIYFLSWSLCDLIGGQPLPKSLRAHQKGWGQRVGPWMVKSRAPTKSYVFCRNETATCTSGALLFFFFPSHFGKDYPSWLLFGKALNHKNTTKTNKTAT